MEQFFQFVSAHWMLWAGLVLILFGYAALEMTDRMGGAQVSPQDVVGLMNHEGAVVLDIRDQAAYAQGHIINARHFPTAEIDQNLTQISAYKNTPVILVCELGRSAARVAMQLRKAGFTRLHILRGGMQAWRTENYPITRAS